MNTKQRERERERERERVLRGVNNFYRKKPIPKGSNLCKLDPFLDEQGLLRIKGRLEHADLTFESKHPVIIPKCHLAKLLVSFQHIFLKHAGVSSIMSSLRSSLWKTGIRRLAKSVTKKCVRCQRHDSRACGQPVAPLPELRVKAAPPFTVTGLDFAGPLFCADFPSKMFYILLFTCAVIRAIHVELTDSMSVFDCMLAIRRFVARRGLPSVLYSDNAKTFVACASELQKVYGHLSPHWKFIIPRSPWWGGWWERLIRSVKSAARKTLGGNYISRCELETTLHEVEVCVNSRPLTYVTDEHDTLVPLSPSHFLIGRSMGYQSQVNTDPSCISAKDLSDGEILRRQTLDKFWTVWSNDYIRNLPCVVKGFSPNCDLEKGDLVLVKEDNLTRLHWPLGVMVDVFPGKDGLIRSVNVKTSKGVITRPIQRLHYLEISSCSSEAVTETINESMSESPLEEPESISPLEKSQSVSSLEKSEFVFPLEHSGENRTRSGRIIKVPKKLDL